MLNMLNMLSRIILSIFSSFLIFGCVEVHVYEVAARKVVLIFTKHAVRRIYERGSHLGELVGYISRNRSLLLKKNREGYEIQVPMKGRLVGDFDDDHRFIVKSFLYPPMSMNRTSNSCVSVVVKGVIFPSQKLARHPSRYEVVA